MNLKGSFNNEFEKSPEKNPGRPAFQPNSLASPSYTPFRTTFASLSLHETDKIRLLGFPVESIPSVRAVIQSSWYRGIQSERIYAASHEFKLLGRPWSGQGPDAVPARIIMRDILARLYSEGWILHATVDVSKKEFDKDTLMFRKQQIPPPPAEWISISFNQMDRLRLIGADQNLIGQFKTLLNGLRLLQEDKGWKDQALGAWEFKIKGHPWSPTGEETMSMRFLLLKMLEVLEQNGWSLYASMDQSVSHQEHTSETDSWYCVKERGWVPGSAVFHR